MIPLLLLSTLSSTGDDLAGRHAPESVVYLEIPDVPAAVDAYGRTALVQTLLDPDLHRVVGQFLGEPEFDPVALLEAEYRAAVERGDLLPLKELVFDPLVSVSASLSAPDGDVMPLILDEIFSRRPEQEVVSDFGFQLELVMETPEAARALFEMCIQVLTDEGGELTVNRDGDRAIAKLAEQGFPAELVHFVQDGSRACLLFGMETPARYFARSDNGGGLEFHDPEAFQGSGVTVFRLHSPAQKQIWSGLPGDWQADWALPLVELAEGIAGPWVAMVARGGQWRIGIDEEGRIHTEGLAPRIDSPRETIFCSQALDPNALDLVHPEAIVAWAGHFNVEGLLEMMNEAATDAEHKYFEVVEEEYGFRPDKHILAPLGGALAYSLPEPKTLLSAPPLTLAAGLTDRAAFEHGMEGLGRMIKLETQGDFEMSRSEYRGMGLYTLEIDWKEIGFDDLPIDPSAFFQLTFAVCDDRVFVTTLPNHAKREIRRILSQDTAGHVGREVPEGAVAVGFADWMRFVSKLYTAARASLPLISAMSGEPLPIDLARLPDAETVFRRFQESRRFKRIAGNGMLHYQESSIGPEFLIAGVVVGAAVSLRSAGVMHVEMEARMQQEIASEMAHVLEQRLVMHRIEHGGWPKDFEELGHTPQLDPWGGTFRFLPDGDEVIVWCSGPNGVDEGGEGDDIRNR